MLYINIKWYRRRKKFFLLKYVLTDRRTRFSVKKVDSFWNGQLLILVLVLSYINIYISVSKEKLFLVS